jgi:hypothetical protein
MSLNIFSGMTAFIVAGLIGATLAFLLLNLGLPKDWFVTVDHEAAFPHASVDRSALT